MLLEINDLHASVEGNEILKGINLQVKPGEVHAIMGPNGSGKSTLGKVIAGHPTYEKTAGSIKYAINNTLTDLDGLEAHERSREGIFLSFQYPVEIPGVNNAVFLRTAYNEICKHQGVEEMDPYDFNEFLKTKVKELHFNESFIQRPVNEGFSGGEKKKNEILQMAILNPRLSILDETDSGLDIDALKVVADGVNRYKNKYNAVVLVTHYQRLLDYIKPNFVHVLKDGQIIKSGDHTLALELENKGYDWLQ